MTNIRSSFALLIGGLLLGLAPQTPFAAPPPIIEVLGVSPRQVAEAPDDIFDQVSSGLPVVGLGQKVYLEADAVEGSPYTSYTWALISKPSGSNATISAAAGDLTTLRPDLAGDYQVRLTPLVGAASSTQTVQLIRAGRFAGANVFNTHADPKPIAPNCGASYCHGENSGTERLRVLDEWKGSNHANKLQNHLSGQRGAYYDKSCLACHSLGYDTNTASVNGGFDDVAQSSNYDLNQLTGLVAQAHEQQIDNFPQLPAVLQNLASVQCESCHGPGSQHPSKLQQADHGIAGVNLDAKQCAQCHDSSNEYDNSDFKFYQWNNSTHPYVDEIEDGRVSTNTSCVKCHTGEGFIQVRVNKQPATLHAEPHGVTCSVCHDPHGSALPNQLRIAGDFTFDSGETYVGAGKGGLCMNCHNSRVANSVTTINTSYRGVHYGPQGDMLLGINGAWMGLAFNSNSGHTARVAETCVACHMADPPASTENVPPTVGSHTYLMRDDKGTTDTLDDVTNVTNACKTCHTTLTTYNRTARADYDGDGTREGIQDEVTGLMTMLRTQIMATYPNVTIDSHNNISITSAGFAKLTTNQKSALYNYNFVNKDGSRGVHNAAYAVQLLQRAYYGAYGHSIVDDYPNIALRGPVQARNQVSGWDNYL